MVEGILVEFQATRPDGCVSLELNRTRADLEAKGIELKEGQSLTVWEPWGSEKHVAAGIVHWNDEWGWGIEIPEDVLRNFQP
jgi:hypothetical protein